MLDALSEISDLSLLLQKRNVSILTAHKYINQTIKIIEHQKDHPGKYTVEAQNAVELGQFHEVDLSEKKAVKLINRAQMLQCLVDSLRVRMLTIRSHRGESDVRADEGAVEYRKLIEDLSIIDPLNWPLNYDDMPSFGQQQIERLTARFSMDAKIVTLGFRAFRAVGGREYNSDIKPLIDAIESIPVSTAECERGFSCMNRVLTESRNRLDISTLSSLMFISILGPPIEKFNPAVYVSNWLNRGRHSAHDTNALARSKLSILNHPYEHLYCIF